LLENQVRKATPNLPNLDSTRSGDIIRPRKYGRSDEIDVRGIISNVQVASCDLLVTNSTGRKGQQHAWPPGKYQKKEEFPH